jgi:hypothetical protein
VNPLMPRLNRTEKSKFFTGMCRARMIVESVSEINRCR